jgi:hypothetical protein
VFYLALIVTRAAGAPVATLCHLHCRTTRHRALDCSRSCCCQILRHEPQWAARSMHPPLPQHGSTHFKNNACLQECPWGPESSAPVRRSACMAGTCILPCFLIACALADVRAALLSCEGRTSHATSHTMDQVGDRAPSPHRQGHSVSGAANCLRAERVGDQGHRLCPRERFVQEDCLPAVRASPAAVASKLIA